MGAHGGLRWLGRAAGGAVLVLLMTIAGLGSAAGAPAAAAGPGVPPVWRPLAAGLTAGAAPTGAPRRGSELCTITATAGEGAWITPEGAVTVLYGKSQVFDFGAKPGYHMTDLVIDGVPKGGPGTPPYEFSAVTTDHSIQVVAAADMFTVTPKPGAHGSILPGEPVKVVYGGSQTFTIKADEHYHLEQLLLDGTTVTPTPTGVRTWQYTVADVHADCSLSASFVTDTFTIRATHGENGVIYPEGEHTVPWGDTPVFSVVPNAGYVTLVSIDAGEPVEWHTNEYVFAPVTANHSIHASFVRSVQSFYIVAGAGVGGAISPSGRVAVLSGRSVNFFITPAEHYHLDQLTVDGQPTTDYVYDPARKAFIYTFPFVSADHTIAAQFRLDTCTIEASTEGQGGTITPAGGVSVEYGANQSFRVLPDHLHIVQQLLVDGNPVSSRLSYMFTNVTTGHTIHAVFAPNAEDETPPFIWSDWWDGKVLAEDSVVTTAVHVEDEEGGSGVQTPTMMLLTPPHGAAKALSHRDLVVDRWSDWVRGDLPTVHPGDYSVRLTASDRAGNVRERSFRYSVAGSAKVGGVPKRIDLTGKKSTAVTDGDWPETRFVRITLRVRSAAGKPVPGAEARLFVYDEASSTCLFRATRLFAPTGKGTYAFKWFPTLMAPDPGWRGDSRTLQLFIPLDGVEFARERSRGRQGSAGKTGHASRPTMAFTTVKVKW